MITDRSVWRGDELGRTTDWIRKLSAEDVTELERALPVAKSRRSRWQDLTRDARRPVQ